ncbi:MAG: ABC transporter permease [Candidatus Paracaedibacteraceae bacterium]|nr:ABC transporter permease [Candidatus Paracaedibacteraceae bacterium]
MLKRISAVLCVILIWQYACVYSGIPEYFLPNPAAIANVFLVNTYLLITHASYTGLEILAGLGLAVILAFMCGIIFTYFPIFDRLFRPVLVVMQSMPSFVFMPLLLLWFGFGMLPKMIIVTLTGFFPMALAFLDGLKRTPAAFCELESLFNATAFRSFVYIRLAAALPAFFTGLRWACLQGSVAVIAADWLGSNHGLGYLILTSYSRLQIPLMFACVIILVMYAHVLMRTVKWIEHRVVFWEGTS